MKNFSKNRDSRRRGERGERPMMHSAVCASCGKSCEVPFRPTGDKPIYCSFCFEKEGGAPPRRRESSGRMEKESRKMFTAQCDSCNSRCEVPFRPSGDKPIYCSSCYENVEQSRGDKKTNREKSGVTRADIAMLGDQLISINSKLEKMILALIPEEKKTVSVKKETLPKKKDIEIKKVEKTPVAKTKTKEKAPAKKKEVKKVVKKVVKNKK
jgi:CxxC-x17-CxxC domain-containing protein